MERTHGSRCRVLIALLGLVVAAGIGLAPATQAFAAGSKDAADLEWSIDLDCTQCHEAQAAALAGIDADGATNDSAKDGSKPDATGALNADVDETEKAAGSSADSSKETGTDEAPETAEASKGGTALEGYAAQHAADFNFECSTCHEDSDKLAAAHKKLNSGKEAERLKKTAVTSDLCLGCHDQEQLARATVDSSVLTDDNGLTVNPHDLPEVNEHADIACVDCHQVHETQKTLEQTAQTTCGSCHHAGVYECGTCH